MTGWWGFDCDGTIAHYDGWGDGSIGAPITPMIRRIKHYLKQGKPVKIVTARVFSGSLDRAQEAQKIWDWCELHLGFRLPLTAEKDKSMVTLFDDRVTQVIPNTGITVQEELRRAVLALREIEVDPTNAYLKAAAALSKLDEWSLKLAGTN